MSHWVLLGIAIVAEVIGTSFLKASDGFTRLLPSVVVVVSFGRLEAGQFGVAGAREGEPEEQEGKDAHDSAAS